MANTKVTTPVTGFNSTNSGMYNTEEGLKLPSGNSSNQPSGAAAEQGMIRNNTGENTGGSVTAIEHFNGTTWEYFAATESSVYPTNLKMFLDAGNAASYSGTGTTWSDLTSNGNDGTLTNMNSSDWYAAGYFNFISSRYIQLPNILTFGSSSYTISVWVNFDQVSNVQLEIFSSYSSTGGFLLDLVATGGVRFYNTGGTNVDINAGNNTAIANTWQLYTVTMDRSSATNVVKLYLGSAQKATTSGTSLGSTNGSNPQIGSYPGGGLYLDGQVSKARVYDTALTQAEIQALVTEGPL